MRWKLYTCEAILEYQYPRVAQVIKLIKSWAQSLFKHMDPIAVGERFAKAVHDYRDKHDVPKRLTFNCDQTEVFFTPCKMYTMASRGAKQVNRQGFDDMRGITMLSTVNANGNLLPPQVIYQGTTNRCHPQNVTFPDPWHITHTPTHWSNVDTMLQYLEKILIPHINSLREYHGVPDQKAILILDDYDPHLDDAFRAALKSANIKAFYVLDCVISELQPLNADGSVNSILKMKMANEFSSYVNYELLRHMADPAACEGFRLDTTISRLKSLQAKWVMRAVEQLSVDKEAIKLGWRRTGLRTRQ